MGDFIKQVGTTLFLFFILLFVLASCSTVRSSQNIEESSYYQHQKMGKFGK